jgi:hypothetical protein
MNTPVQTQTTEITPATHSRSLSARLLDVLVNPGEVFDEIIAAPITVSNWLLPLLLAGFVGGLLAQSGGSGKWSTWFGGSVGAAVGTLWSAWVLWFIGRVFLSSRFSFLKTLEVVGLTTSISVLGMVVTALLIAALGNSAARPALSLLTLNWPSGSHLCALLDALNLFYLWSTTVLAIGLARLSRSSFKESGLWVFGYWICLRMVITLLA